MTFLSGLAATTDLAQATTSLRGQSSRLSTSQSTPPAVKVWYALSIFPDSNVPFTSAKRETGKYLLYAVVSRTVTLVLAPGHADPPAQTAAVSWFPIAPAHGMSASN